ncbi:MAG TPA: PRC-barrel domain-containing protein [Methyloceanibacter sp.]|jgi:PRC-barrel domain|nr:PRC-barrel domain-containing protein [Methyloceanibacter sp.]
MNRFLTTTAVGLFLGLAPVIAQDLPPANDAQTPPAASQPSQSPQVSPDPAQPSDPAAPIPGDSSQVSPSPMEPSDDAAPPAQSSQAPESIEPAAPAAPKSAEASDSPQFLSKQASDDWLASNLIGQSVYNAQDEMVGDINDLVTDHSGKIVAVLVGSGGFLGLGEKDVALRFEDLRLAREDNDSIKIVADVSKETLAAAPDYETLAEQEVTVGSTKDDREDIGGETTN